MLIPEQCRAARALLGLKRGELAAAAGVSERTVIDFERGARNPHAPTLAAIRAALEEAGVEILDPNGGGAGVRLKAKDG